MSLNRTIIILFSLLSTCFLTAQNQAMFSHFQYTGNDTVFKQAFNPSEQFQNPIIAGFYPDPSICRKGNDFYLVNSSFAFFPGIPIFKSNDLVHWTQIGNVLDRPSQLKLDGIRISGGIYAASIHYNKNNDTFYLITTCVDGIGNFIVSTKNPASAWSDPILLPTVGGIDPSLFFDDNNKTYILNNDAPIETPEWDGHRAIWMREYDLKTNKVIGESKVILNGGADFSQKPIWIEGPHIYKRNGKYILFAAEGGTSTQHSQVALISDSVFGPYEAYKNNPVLTQRDLPENRNPKITSTGHADLVEDIDGKTWAVFLGCRPYEDNYYNIGRETFLLPVTWKNNIPVILEKGESVPTIVNKPNLENKKTQTTGNFTWQDNFNSKKLNDKWLMIRSPKAKWYSLKQNKLIINAIDNNIYDIEQAAFLGHRQQHSNFEVICNMHFEPQNSNELAGLVCYQNEKYNFVFAKTIFNHKPCITLTRTAETKVQIANIEIPVQYKHAKLTFKIVGKGANYSFYVSFKTNSWQCIAENVDAQNLSTQNAGGFTGTLIGPYATGRNIQQ